MDDRFKDVKADFELMTDRFRRKEISRREYIESLKHMRFKDEEGRFWMIGAQTGKWYFFDGTGWVQSDPPSLGEKKAICIYCGYENDLESPVCAGCGGRFGSESADGGACPACGSRLDPETGACPSCPPRSGSGLTRPIDAATASGSMGRDHTIRSFHPLSFLLFSGGMGLAAGVLAGLLAGATSFLPGVSSVLPAFLKDMQGKLVGGVLYAGLGGIGGFVLLGVAGFLAALLANAILSFTGGLKIRLTGPAEKGPETRD